LKPIATAFLTVALLCVTPQLFAAPTKDPALVEATAVIERVMPHLAGQIHLTLSPGTYGGKTDGFRITGRRGDIHVQAATVPTLLFGVNWYLKYVAHLNISTDGSRLGAPGLVLPAVATPIEKPALYPFRYALNENTDGYTTPYWDLARWRHEIDILALSGFNAILIQRGVDLVMYRAFRDAGYTDEAIRHWITHPAHQNWQLMGNMCCFIEPISLALMEKRAASGRKVVDMLRALGMTPVLPGFYGVVPVDFAKQVKGAHVVVQAQLWNGLQRPGWLDPRDPAFAKLAASFYKHQHELFGDTTIYDMETFQEGGNAGDVPVKEGAQAIQAALEAAHPGALWFMMAWQDNPKHELIDAVDRSRILIADIEQGRFPNDKREQEFEGARWLYGGLWEFGGRTTMGAPLHDYAVRMPLMAAKPGSHISGTALFTEGLDTNPFAYDLYTEMAWRAEPVDIKDWTDAYATRRYGANDPHAQQAWQIMQKTAYGYRGDGIHTHGERDASQDSLFAAQPGLTVTRAAHPGPDVVRYPIEDLRPALTELLAVAPNLRNSDAYRFDLTDLTRQILANESRLMLPRIKAAYEAKDAAKLKELETMWLHEMALQDKLLAANDFFLVGKWLSYVPAWSSSPEDLEHMNYDARSLITTWAQRQGAEHGLNDYGNRDWAGLTRDYYIPRWQAFLETLNTALATNTEPAKIDWFAFGERWNHGTQTYSPQAAGDTYAIATEIAEVLHLAPR
jgi:alpha-N-acetylglucosaminidase